MKVWVLLVMFVCAVPPTITPMEAAPIGVETRDGRPSDITVGFTITRSDPEVQLENITWTYTINDTNMDVQDLVMEDSSKYQLSDNLRTLTIFNLSFFDAGSITLTASNEAGTVSSTLQLIVHGQWPHPPL